jgi:hypothetical protein
VGIELAEAEAEAPPVLVGAEVTVVSKVLEAVRVGVVMVLLLKPEVMLTTAELATLVTDVTVALLAELVTVGYTEALAVALAVVDEEQLVEDPGASLVEYPGAALEEEDWEPPQALLSILKGNEYWKRLSSPTEVILIP